MHQVGSSHTIQVTTKIRSSHVKGLVCLMSNLSLLLGMALPQVGCASIWVKERDGRLTEEEV